jgi:hypothetical protein
MFQPIELHGQVMQERIEREIASAARHRVTREPAPSIRQSIGHRIIAIGARVAAEPSLESGPAR